MVIATKQEFFMLWQQGVLGNRSRLWYNAQEAWDAGCPEYGFREHAIGGGRWEGVKRFEFWDTVARWAGRHYSIDDRAPDDYQTIQGEICRTYRGLEGYIGASKIPMRRAMALGLLRPRSGSEVLTLVRDYMDPSSQDDLWALLELYPDATVEFACFSCDVGNIPNRNTIFWETRNY